MHKGSQSVMWLSKIFISFEIISKVYIKSVYPVLSRFYQVVKNIHSKKFINFYLVSTLNISKMKISTKSSIYGKHWILQPMWIIEKIQQQQTKK